MIEKDEFKKQHFDAGSDLFIKWDHTNPQAAAEELKVLIRNSIPEAKMQDDPA